MNPATMRRFRRIGRGLLGIIVIAACWPLFAGSGVFAPALAPGLSAIVHALGAALVNGALVHHAADTLGRVLLALTIAAVVGELSKSQRSSWL